MRLAMHKSLSAVALDKAGFVKSLAVLTLYVVDQSIDQELAVKLSNWAKQGREYATALDIKAEYAKAVQFVSRHPDYDEDRYDSNVGLVEELAEALYVQRAEYKDDSGLPQDYVNVLNDVLIVIRKDSEKALERLSVRVNALKESDISLAYITQDVEGQEDELKSIRAIVKKLTGKPADALSVTDSKKYREEKPELYKEYLAVNRELNKRYKEALRIVVRSSGDALMDIDEAVEQLKDQGISRINLPTGFEGKVDENGKLHTTDGKQIDGGVSNTTVQMNPRYDPKQDNGYVFTAVPFGGQKPQHYYTVNYRHNKRQDRFKQVQNLGDTIAKLKSRWRSIMIKPGTNQIPALLIEVVYQTSARIGSNPTRGEKEARGIRTIKVKNVQFKGQSMRIRYVGKADKVQVHILNGAQNRAARKAISMIRDLVEGKEPLDYVFTDANDNLVSYSRVSTFLASINSPVKLHKFRHLRGTEMATRILSSSPLYEQESVTQAAANKWLREEMEKVGKVLGHYAGTKVTGNTAIKYYINPEVAYEFFDKLGLRVPTFIPKKGEI